MNTKNLFLNDPLGFVHQTQDLILFFGNKNSGVDEFKKRYPSLSFFNLKQVHGKKCIFQPSIESTDSSRIPPEADGHWTTTKKLALCIATADCMPVFFHSVKHGLVGAAHAGWRGVANKICFDLLAQTNLLLDHDPDLKVYVGPHILKRSFTIHQDTLSELLGTEWKNRSEFYEPVDSNQFHFDLLSFLRKQFLDFGVKKDNIINLSVDTKTDLNFHSYRRDRENSGRQISFIALI